MRAIPLDPAHEAPRAPVTIRRIDVSDLVPCLRQGLADFLRRPSHYVFLAAIYPVAGIVIALFATNARAFPVLFPLVAGFALVGPVAALGFYEISRRQERGEAARWADALGVLRSPARPAITKVALLLCALFLLWLVSAQVFFLSLVPDFEANTYGGFLREVLAAPAGWALILFGNLLGLLFAVVAFSLSVVSLPLILDRHVGAAEAIRVSVEAVRLNPVPMAAWGLITAALLVAGSLPLLVGLALVLPVMGHATWHLYRRVIG